MTSPLLTRARREVTLLEAVLNTTTPFDRLLIELDSQVRPLRYAEVHAWIVPAIRKEFHRLRRKKGHPG